MERKEIIKQLRGEGKTYQEIGNTFHISRQRVHQILTGYPPSLPKPRNEVLWLSPNLNRPYNTEDIRLEGRDFWKEVVRRRDDYTCQICGKIWQPEQRRFDAHHLDENLEGENGRKYENCKCIDRMITLCHRCHLRLDTVRKKMSKAYRKNKPVDKPLK